jgi:hypothetical protein
VRKELGVRFGLSESQLSKYDGVGKEDLLKAYTMMQLCRQFENACNQAYMQGKIRGFMHLDNGQVSDRFPPHSTSRWGGDEDRDDEGEKQEEEDDHDDADLDNNIDYDDADGFVCWLLLLLQESIPALVADSIRVDDIKHSYYREHTHAIASGVHPDRVMAELFAKVGRHRKEAIPADQHLVAHATYLDEEIRKPGRG